MQGPKHDTVSLPTVHEIYQPVLNELLACRLGSTALSLCLLHKELLDKDCMYVWGVLSDIQLGT